MRNVLFSCLMLAATMGASNQSVSAKPFVHCGSHLKQSLHVPLKPASSAKPHLTAAKNLTPVQLAQLVLPSVVRLVVLDDKGQPFKLGSGFVVGPNLIATNIHVIRGGHTVRAEFGSGRMEEVYGCVATDAPRDLVLLYANTQNIRPLPLMTNTPQIGDEVIAVGSPEGYSGSLSTGIISQIRRDGGTKVYQTTAPISHGSSGGALMDMQGRVLGITAFTNVDGQNLNFAYPAYYLQNLLPHSLPVYVSWADLGNGNSMLGKDPDADKPLAAPTQTAAQTDTQAQVTAVNADIAATQTQIDACNSAITTFQSQESDPYSKRADLRQTILTNEAQRQTLVAQSQNDAINSEEQSARAAQINSQGNGGSAWGAAAQGLQAGAAQGQANKLAARSLQESSAASQIATEDLAYLDQYNDLDVRVKTIDGYISDQNAKLVILQGNLDALNKQLLRLTGAPPAAPTETPSAGSTPPAADATISTP